MQFRYVAYTLREGVLKGYLEADNEVEARSEIVRLGYKPLVVKPRKVCGGLGLR